MRCQLRVAKPQNNGLIVISFATKLTPSLLGCVKSGMDKYYKAFSSCVKSAVGACTLRFGVGTVYAN